jgi:hypothetical protein
MIIDFHTHIFPRSIRQNREKLFPTEPSFKLLYQSANSRLIGARELIDIMDQDGVDRSVIFGFPWKSHSAFIPHNDYILEMVQKYPNRLIGLGCFEPSGQAAVREAERFIGAGGSGIGELAFYETGINEDALDRLVPIMNLCAGQNLPVLIHTNEPVGHHYHGKTPITLAQIYRLIRRFPDNKIVLAHWGGGLFFYGLMKKEVKESLGNVFFDTAASPYLYDAGVYQIADQTVGIDKVLFGSDYPLLPPRAYFKDMAAAGLSKAQMDKIKGENAKQLFEQSLEIVHQNNLNELEPT